MGKIEPKQKATIQAKKQKCKEKKRGLIACPVETGSSECSNVNETKNIGKQKSAKKTKKQYVVPKDEEIVLCQCGVCNRKFLYISFLQDHMKIHLGYKCQYCRETIITSTPFRHHVFINNEAPCLLKKWREMEKYRCFVDVNSGNFS